MRPVIQRPRDGRRPTALFCRRPVLADHPSSPPTCLKLDCHCHGHKQKGNSAEHVAVCPMSALNDTRLNKKYRPVPVVRRPRCSSALYAPQCLSQPEKRAFTSTAVRLIATTPVTEGTAYPGVPGLVVAAFWPCSLSGGAPLGRTAGPGPVCSGKTVRRALREQSGVLA